MYDGLFPEKPHLSCFSVPTYQPGMWGPSFCLSVMGTLDLYLLCQRTLVFLPVSPTLSWGLYLSSAVVHQFAQHPYFVAAVWTVCGSNPLLVCMKFTNFTVVLIKGFLLKAVFLSTSGWIIQLKDSNGKNLIPFSSSLGFYLLNLVIHLSSHQVTCSMVA